jgi:hypothetical protein
MQLLDVTRSKQSTKLPVDALGILFIHMNVVLCTVIVPGVDVGLVIFECALSSGKDTSPFVAPAPDREGH